MLTCQNQLDSFSRFDRTPTWDRQTDTNGHRPMASIYRGCIASRGKKCVGLSPMAETIHILDVSGSCSRFCLLFINLWSRGSITM